MASESIGRSRAAGALTRGPGRMGGIVNCCTRGAAAITAKSGRGATIAPIDAGHEHMSVQLTDVAAPRAGTPEASYLPLDLRALRLESTVPFDLFILVGPQYVLYRSRDLPFESETLESLLSNQVQTLYVPADSSHELAEYFERHLSGIISDSSVPTAERARAVSQVAEMLAMETLRRPSKELAQRSIAMAEQLTTFVMGSADALTRLLHILGTGTTLEAHSANVSILAVAMAPQAPQLTMEVVAKLSLAGLMHDIGMALVPPEVMIKPTALTTSERDVVEQHPVTGAQMLMQMGAYPEGVPEAVRAHHERLDGTGYPDNLRGSQIPWLSRATAIAEVFDSLTSDQPYRARMTPFEALRVMQRDMRGKLDGQLIRDFIPRLIGDASES